MVAMIRALTEEVAAADPGQRVLTVITDAPMTGEMAEVAKEGMVAYREVHKPRGTTSAVAGLSRTHSVLLRTYHMMGARGRLFGDPDEQVALDWLLSH
jgi:hypothetical protein